MLDTETKRRIDSARDILVGKVPDPNGTDLSKFSEVVLDGNPAIWLIQV